MTIFEPLFLLVALSSGVALFLAALRWARGQRAGARRLLGRLAISVVTYVAVVAVTSLFVPGREYGVGDPQCFDDWCITVVGARWTNALTAPEGARYEVALRLSSRARRRPMGERGTVVYLTDGRGQRFDPVSDQTDIGLDTVLQPGQSVTATRSFALPREARGLGLVYAREGGFPIGWLVIGEVGWFHRPPVVRLE